MVARKAIVHSVPLAEQYGSQHHACRVASSVVKRGSARELSNICKFPGMQTTAAVLACKLLSSFVQFVYI